MKLSGPPVPISDFVGRSGDLAELARLVGEARLITLTGPAGIGKTRLAIEVASASRPHVPGGTGWVELARLNSDDEVPAAVAKCLGISPRRNWRPVEEAAAFLDHRPPVLLVLDNGDHVLGACADVARHMLHSCAGLTIIVTSQAPIGLAGERVWPVSPLSVEASEREETEASEAVKLFADRARDIRPDFVMDASVHADVVEICRRLDGIPLAIELAAARVDALSPAEIAGRLDDRFKLLTRRANYGISRHRSLQAALDWSFELLPQKEKGILGRLSVFAGSFTLPAAVEVCAGNGIGDDEVLRLVMNLVGKSLLSADTSAGGTRYRLLETIRAYAADRLAECDEEAKRVRTVHAEWCIRLAESLRDASWGSDAAGEVEMEMEYGNLRTALSWSLSSGRNDLAVHLAAALVPHWRSWGKFGEGLSWLASAHTGTEPPSSPVRKRAAMAAASLARFTDSATATVESLQQIVENARRTDDAAGLAQSLNLLGFVSMMAHGPAVAMPVLEESVALARSAGDRQSLPRLLCGWGAAYRLREDPVAAKPIFAECLSTARAVGDDYATCGGLLGLGWVALRNSECDAAERDLTEALRLSRRLGERYETAVTITFLAELARLRGMAAKAQALAEEGLALARRMQTPYPIANALLVMGRLQLNIDRKVDLAEAVFDEVIKISRRSRLRSREVRGLQGLADVARLRSDSDAAHSHLSEALDLARDYGDLLAVANSLFGLGMVVESGGDDTEARRLHREAIEIRSKMGDAKGVASSLEAFAVLAAGSEPATSARLFGAATALRKARGLEARPGGPGRAAIEAAVRTTRKTLGREQFTTAWEAGQALKMRQAVAYALRERAVASRSMPSRYVPQWSSLTRAERDVVALATEGFTNREIGERLFIAPNTVKNHLANVFPKLGVSSRRELRDQFRNRDD